MKWIRITDKPCPDCGVMLVYTNLENYWCPNCGERKDISMIEAMEELEKWK